MMINDGKGLFDKYGLIDSVIADLNRLRVDGIGSMSIVCDIYNRLTALKEGLRREEKADGDDPDQQG